MVEDAYGRLARRYNVFLRSSSERRTFFTRLFARCAVERVLDCACGTGDDLLFFSSLGVVVVGSDISRAMLDVAGTKLKTSRFGDSAWTFGLP